MYVYSMYFTDTFETFVCLEDKVWTTVMSNLPPKTTVTGSSKDKRTILQVNYSASMDQVSNARWCSG